MYVKMLQKVFSKNDSYDIISLSVTVGEQYSTSIKGDLFWILLQ